MKFGPLTVVPCAAIVVVTAEIVTAPVAPEMRILFPAMLDVTPEFVKVRLPVEEVMVRPVEPVRETATQFGPFEPKILPAEVVAMAPTVVPPVRSAPLASDDVPRPPEFTASGLVSESVPMDAEVPVAFAKFKNAMVEEAEATRFVPVAFVKVRPVTVDVAKVEFTAITGVPVAEESTMFGPAVSDWTPMFAKVRVDGEVEVVIETPAPAENTNEVSVRPASVEVTNGRVFVTVMDPAAFCTLMPVLGVSVASE